MELCQDLFRQWIVEIGRYREQASISSRNPIRLSLRVWTDLGDRLSGLRDDDFLAHDDPVQDSGEMGLGFVDVDRHEFAPKLIVDLVQELVNSTSYSFSRFASTQDVKMPYISAVPSP